MEVAITVGIAAVVTALAIPTFRTSFAHYSLTGAGRNLLADLRLAQGLAVKENTAYQLFFDPLNSTYQIEKCPCNLNPGGVHGTVQQTQRALNESNTIGHGALDLVSVQDTSSADRPIVQFGTNGLVTIPTTVNFPLTATLRSNATGEQIQVNVCRMGRVYVVSAGDTGC